MARGLGVKSSPGREDRVPGRDRDDREIVYVPNVCVPFPTPNCAESGNFSVAEIFHAQCDWTIGAPDNGKFRVVPRSHPLRALVLYFTCLVGGKQKVL